jgi:cytochrome b561
MEQISNSSQRYGLVAIVLHWLMALLLVALVLLGLYIVSLPDAGFDKHKITLILLHKELGLIAMMLAALRLAWRIGNVLPALVATLPDWQKITARFVHLSFYGLMLALPISGWLMSSAAAIPVSFLGLFDLPDLIGHDELLFRSLIVIHRWLAYALIACLLVHAGAALAHHLVFKDDTLKKMLPGRG